MANDIKPGATLGAKKPTAEPAKPAGTSEHLPISSFHTNAQDFVDWVDRLTNHFQDVTPAMFETIKAAFDSLAPADQTNVTQLGRDNRALIALLTAPVYARFEASRSGGASPGEDGGSR